MTKIEKNFACSTLTYNCKICWTAARCISVPGIYGPGRSDRLIFEWLVRAEHESQPCIRQWCACMESTPWTYIQIHPFFSTLPSFSSKPKYSLRKMPISFYRQLGKVFLTLATRCFMSESGFSQSETSLNWKTRLSRLDLGCSLNVYSGRQWPFRDRNFIIEF